jgi:hypothetical protein
MKMRAPVFDQIIADYLGRVAAISDRSRLSECLGVTVTQRAIAVPFFNGSITITDDAVIDDTGATPGHSTSVSACQYLLRCPDRPGGDTVLCTYKDFRHAAPYVGGFRNTVERPIARVFGGRVERLEAACRTFGGQPYDTDVLCDLAFSFQALPRVPIFLLFHDADEEFPAQCTLLFQRDAADYLDMECLAMLGGILAHHLANG